MSDDSRSPSLGEILNLTLDAFSARLNVSIPAQVVAYDATKQTVNARPSIKKTTFDENGDKAVKSLPVLANVPVLFPGGGGFRMTFPLVAGDTVLLVFSDRSLDKWKTSGIEVDPIDLREHHLGDAVAIPVVHSNANLWTGASGNQVSWGRDGGSQVVVKPAEIDLGVGASHPVIQGDTMQAALNSAMTALNSALTAIAAAIPSIGTLSVNGPAAAIACTSALTQISGLIASSYLSSEVKTT